MYSNIDYGNNMIIFDQKIIIQVFKYNSGNNDKIKDTIRNFF
jgi:hypothetical protein